MLQMLIEGQVTVYINLINKVMFFIIKMWFPEVQMKKDERTLKKTQIDEIQSQCNPRWLLKKNQIKSVWIEQTSKKMISFHVCIVVREFKEGRSQGKDIYRQG